MTEGFEKLCDVLMDRAEDLEDAVCHDPKPDLMNRILQMRREVTHLVRTVRDQRDVASVLLRSTDGTLTEEFRPWFRDVYDHLSRVHGQMEGVLNGLAASREAYHASVNNRLGDAMRLLTLVATIMMPLNLVAGIFGMNFVHIPGLDSPAAFWVTMVAMGMTVVFMIAWFRRQGWL
jgi:magnesium transporter